MTLVSNVPPALTAVALSLGFYCEDTGHFQER